MLFSFFTFFVVPLAVVPNNSSPVEGVTRGSQGSEKPR